MILTLQFKMCSNDILHPELLPPQKLLHILLERRIKIDGLEEMDRERLLQIYNQFCLPFAQRKKERGNLDNTLEKNRKQEKCINRNAVVSYPKLINNPPILTQDKKKTVEYNAPLSKRIRLSTSELTDNINNKRKFPNNDCEMVETNVIKRTKITWP